MPDTFVGGNKPSTSASMASPGFRPPQFSDDVAWLPTWLQPHVATTTFGVANMVDEIHLEQSLPQMDPFRGSTCQDNAGSFWPRRERQSNSFHLYLSGEDNSSISCNPSSNKVLQLNLHLSADGSSSYISSPLVGVSQVDKHKSSCIIPVQPVETRPRTKEIIQDHMNYNSGFSDLFPRNSEQKSIDKDRDQVLNDMEDEVHKDLLILTPTESLDAETDTAVELSIAASEALVIHELMQDGSGLPAFSAAEILELALQVKKARLEVFKGSCINLREEINKLDVSSELNDCNMDDSDMEDAYRDVGLSTYDLDNVTVEDSTMSKVKCTPISQQGSVSVRKIDNEQQRHAETYSTKVPSKQHSKMNIATQTSTCNMSDEIPDDEKQKKQPHYHAMKFISSSASYLDPEFEHASNGHLDDWARQQVDSTSAASVDIISQQKASSSHPWNSRKVIGHLDPEASHHVKRGEHKTTNMASFNFQSRWFGGWTGKEEKASGGVKSKSIAKYFAGESSFLSESNDAAPDEKSFVYNHHEISNASQPSVHLEVLGNTVNIDAGDCQDTAKDSSSSYIDPLCSVVPCSISTDTGNSPLTKCADANGTDAYGNFKENLVNMVENVQFAIDHVDGAGKYEGSDKLVVDAASCRPILRRQTNSLKVYSAGRQKDHKCIEVSNSNSKWAYVLKHNTKLLPYEHPISCVDSSVEKDIAGSVKSIAIDNIAKDNVENHEAPVVGHISRVLTGQKEHHKKTAKDGPELQVLHDQQSSPFLLRHASQRRCQAPDPSIRIFAELQNENLDSGPVADCLHSRHLDGPALLHEMPCDLHRLPRKRVRFVDGDADVLKKKKLWEPKSTSVKTTTHKIGLCSIVVERPHQLEMKSRKIKERLTNCLTRHKNSIFQGLDFLLTGFTVEREKELESLLKKHGGTVLSDIPSPSYPKDRTSSRFNSHQLPVVLCTKKLLTAKFLYGCAANAFLLKVHWATNSLKRGRLLPPEKYMVLSHQADRKPHRIGKEVCQGNFEHVFDKVGIMLHGRHSFCIKFSAIVKHGRGRIYKTLQWLLQGLQAKKINLGAIVVEDGTRATRHLEKFASEQKLPMLPASWIVDSLYQGKLLPFPDKTPSHLPAIKVPEVSVSQEWSQEI